MCWNVKGIAEQILIEMKEDNADINNIDDYTHEGSEPSKVDFLHK